MNKRLAVTVAAVPFLLAACGGSSTEATHQMSDGTVMSGSSMSESTASPDDDMSVRDAVGSGSGAPSESASMVCGDEIRDAVTRIFALSSAPRGLHSWSGHTYRCSYQLGGGDLRMSVKDLDTAGPGRAYYDALKRRLPGATDIAGLANYGFPAFETPQGDVAFLKDHKTLWVDATRLARSDLPDATSRQDAAYAVAAAVIACWTE